MDRLVFLVLDTETTGTDPSVDQVVELGYVATTIRSELGRGSSLAKPSVSISAGASAVHHLIDEDLQDADSLSSAIESLSKYREMPETIAYVAHNAPFDKSFLPQIADKPWLDTYRLAKRYLPDLPHHTNQFLRYHLRLDVPRDTPAHRAIGDCIVTAALLRFLLTGPAAADFEGMGTEEFRRLIDGPMLIQSINFGKHAGKKFSEVPADYLSWMIRTGGFDQDTTFTAKYYLSNK